MCGGVQTFGLHCFEMVFCAVLKWKGPEMCEFGTGFKNQIS